MSTNLLFDDVMWAQRAREEHDAFAQKLRDKGVKVHLFADLLARALDQPGGREFVQDELTTATRFGPALDKPLDELVAHAPADRLSEALIGVCSSVTSPSTTRPACCSNSSIRTTSC
jgi:arginine deiminase